MLSFLGICRKSQALRDAKIWMRSIHFRISLSRKGHAFTPSSKRDTCRTLVYAPNTDRINNIMNIFAEMNGLTMDVDIIGVSS